MRYEDLRSGGAPCLLGVAAIFVLLVVLHQVLRGAVRQGASLQLTNAQRVETNWRCSAAHGPRLRDDCIVQRTQATSKDVALLLANAQTREP
jgi:hypothetical protein